MLGDAQLTRYDNEINNNNNTKSLQEAEKSFKASLELEGKPSGGKEIPFLIQEQEWWKDSQCLMTKTDKATSSKTGNCLKEKISPTKITANKSRGKIPL